MTTEVRLDVIGGVWAKNAPDVTGGVSPTPLVTYGKTNIEESEIETGWPYTKVNDSAAFNEMMRRITTLVQMLEQHGILPWSVYTEYKTGALCVGPDDLIYRALQDHSNENPVYSLAHWGDPNGTRVANVLGASGYQKFPGGLIIQWGVFSLGTSSGASQSVAFSITFPFAFISALIGVANASTDAIGYQNQTTSGMNITKGVGDTEARTGTWFAIGY